MTDRIEIHIRANRGVPTDLLVTISKALDKSHPGATLNGACDCCNFHIVGGDA